MECCWSWTQSIEAAEAENGCSSLCPGTGRKSVFVQTAPCSSLWYLSWKFQVGSRNRMWLSARRSSSIETAMLLLWKGFDQLECPLHLLKGISSQGCIQFISQTSPKNRGITDQIPHKFLSLPKPWSTGDANSPCIETLCRWAKS